MKEISYLCNTYRNYIREVQEQYTEHLPSMIVPLWWFARPLTPRVKGCEGLCSFYFKKIYCEVEQLVALRAHNPKALKRFTQVRILFSLQTKELITLWLMGSKPSMEYGVKVHGRTSTSIVLSTHGKGNRFKVQILIILLYCGLKFWRTYRSHKPNEGLFDSDTRYQIHFSRSRGVVFRSIVHTDYRWSVALHKIKVDVWRMKKPRRCACTGERWFESTLRH